MIKKATYSEWSAPIVAIPKHDGFLCLCEDYEVTMKPVLNIE